MESSLRFLCYCCHCHFNLVRNENGFIGDVCYPHNYNGRSRWFHLPPPPQTPSLPAPPNLPWHLPFLSPPHPTPIHLHPLPSKPFPSPPHPAPTHHPHPSKPLPSPPCPNISPSTHTLSIPSSPRPCLISPDWWTGGRDQPISKGGNQLAGTPLFYPRYPFQRTKRNYISDATYKGVGKGRLWLTFLILILFLAEVKTDFFLLLLSSSWRN